MFSSGGASSQLAVVVSHGQNFYNSYRAKTRTIALAIEKFHKALKKISDGGKKAEFVCGQGYDDEVSHYASAKHIETGEVFTLASLYENEGSQLHKPTVVLISFLTGGICPRTNNYHNVGGLEKTSENFKAYMRTQLQDDPYAAFLLDPKIYFDDFVAWIISDPFFAIVADFYAAVIQHTTPEEVPYYLLLGGNIGENFDLTAGVAAGTRYQGAFGFGAFYWDGMVRALTSVLSYETVLLVNNRNFPNLQMQMGAWTWQLAFNNGVFKQLKVANPGAFAGWPAALLEELSDSIDSLLL